MMKRILITICLIWDSLLFSQRNLIIYSEPLKALSEYELDDCTMNDRSITFFLPLKHIDETTWKKSLLQFINQCKLETLDINVIFFNRNQGVNSGLKVLDKNKKNIFSPFQITCVVSGYDEKNLARIKAKTDVLYTIQTIDTEKVSLVNVTEVSECPPNFTDKNKETMAKIDLERYKPFLTELFFPKYSTEEKFNQLFARIELLEESNDQKDRKIEQLETKISELKNSSNNSSSKVSNEKQEQKVLFKKLRRRNK